MKSKIKIILFCMVFVFSLTFFGCMSHSNRQTTQNDEKTVSDIYNDSSSYDFYNYTPEYLKEEYSESLYQEYLNLASDLKDQNNLTNDKIIELCNSYKHLKCSIDNIDITLNNASETEHFTTDDTAYTSMCENLIDLLYDNSVLLLPNNTTDYQKREILQSYLTNTNQTPLNNIHIIGLNDNGTYYVMSDDGKLFFEIYASSDEYDTLNISLESDLNSDTIKRLSSKSISIIDTHKAIPYISNVKSRLIDNAELLENSEEDILSKKLDEISERQKFDVVIVTTNTLNGKTVQAYADDFYDENGYGFGEKNDGILLLVSTEADPSNNYRHITTTGFGITAFTDEGLQWLVDQIKPLLEEGKYTEAFNDFAKYSDDFLTQARSDKPYDNNNLP